MPGLIIERFFGVVPRDHSGNLPKGYAEDAIDVNLRHGTLRPWREPKLVSTVPANAETVYQSGCCWLPWAACVEVATWRAECPRLYVTGSAPYPVMATVNDDCTTSAWCRVGVPAPPNALSAVPHGSPSGNIAREVSGYVYTYVNDKCEEGPPSWPSNVFVVTDGDPVTVTGFVAPDPEWCVTSINIYREVSAMMLGTEKETPNETGYFLVATVPVGTSTYVDTLPTYMIGRSLTTRDALPPPPELRGLITVFQGDTMAGFVGNHLYFSRAGEPWNWPISQMMVLDDPIVAIASPDQRTVHVVTQGAGYSIQAEVGCKDMTCRHVTKYNAILPGIVCCSNRGIVTTGLGTVYVSADGLVALSGTSPPVVITSPWYAPEDWRRLRPETMRLGWYAGTIFCISDNAGLVLTASDGVYAKWDTLQLSTISDRPKTMVTGSNGELFFHDASGIRQWDAGNIYRPFKWRSRLIEASAWLPLSTGRVRVDGVARLKLVTRGRTVFDRMARDNSDFRITPYGRHLLHNVEVTGTDQVWRVHLATSRWDLMEAKS